MYQYYWVLSSYQQSVQKIRAALENLFDYYYNACTCGLLIYYIYIFLLFFSLQRITWDPLDQDRELCLLKGKSEVRKTHNVFTLSFSDSWTDRFCTKIQSSRISEFLGIFQDQKMDIISCHDCQFVSCQNQITRLTWFDFKYKKVHIHGIWDNENECN